VTLELTDLTPEFGARVVGLDASAPLRDDDARLLRQAFDARGVLLFRDLHDLDAGYQAYLASTVIGRENAAGAGDPDGDGAYYVSNRRTGGGAPFGRLLFHSDMMWSDEPVQVLTHYALEVEEPVVPTTFTSATSTWSRLPDALRARIEPLHAVHVTGQQARGGEGDGELLQAVRDTVHSATKPVACRHPRTGDTILYVSQMMTERVAELPGAESGALLDELFAYLYDPATTWTHEWRNGDLVMWDNLAIQHARGNVAVEGPVRTLRKVIAPRVDRTERDNAPTFSKAR
jgi:taurine dioxygenase